MEQMTDILARLEQRARKHATNSELLQKDSNSQPHGLLPGRHPVRDFFIADILDCALKDDRHTMEHPFFSLSKKPDHRVREYERDGVHITIKPGADGMATIWDKDILLYCVSVLTEGLNQGRRDINRTVRLKAYDFLVTTSRHTGGRDYDLLAAALNRLKGTVINTDIKTNGARRRDAFGLIDNWSIVERTSNHGRMSAVAITLNEWLYGAVVAHEVLTLHHNYFRLDGGLERRLYELARKHCGRQPKWAISLELLHLKSGSTAKLKEFRRKLKIIAQADQLPSYRMRYDRESDQVLFYTKDAKKLAETVDLTSGLQTPMTHIQILV